MKGMMSLLERAGLVRQEGAGAVASAAPVPDETPVSMPGSGDAQGLAAAPSAAEASPASAPAAGGQTLEQVYEGAQVPPSAYPAERLLRLIGGLNAMDDALRRQTIHAIDAADESWTIDDPLRDAAAKISAIEQHASALRAGLGQAEQQAQAELAELRRRQEAAVSEIRRQIADLEGLLSREIARGAQESAAVEAALQSRKEAVSQELATLSRAASDFRGLIGQFKTNVTQ